MALSGGQLFVGLIVIAIISYLVWYYYICPEGKAERAVRSASSACQLSVTSGLDADHAAATAALVAAATAITNAALYVGATITVMANGTLVLNPVTSSTRLSNVITAYNNITCLAASTGAATPPTPTTGASTTVTPAVVTPPVAPVLPVHKSGCENDYATAGVTCPAGKTLRISNFKYGPPTGAMCGGAVSSTCGRDYTTQVQALVNNGTLAFPQSFNAAFGDPCSGIYKQFDYDYTCS